MSSNINKNNILDEYQPYDIKTNTSDNDNSNQPLIFVEHDDSRKQTLFRKSNLSYSINFYLRSVYKYRLYFFFILRPIFIHIKVLNCL